MFPCSPSTKGAGIGDSKQRGHFYWDSRGIMLRFPARTSDFLYCSKTSRRSQGPHLAVYSLGTGAWFWPLVSRLRMNGAIPPLPHMSQWRAQKNCTFALILWYCDFGMCLPIVCCNLIVWCKAALYCYVEANVIYCIKIMYTTPAPYQISDPSPRR